MFSFVFFSYKGNILSFIITVKKRSVNYFNKNNLVPDNLGSLIISKNQEQLGFYLAGLIEGDGSIIVPKTIRNKKGNLLYPVIKFIFVSKDLPLANKIKAVLKGGTFCWSLKRTYVTLLIQDTKTLYFLAKLIKGKMRTPKIEALHRLIEWLNKRPNNKALPKLVLDSSPLFSNSWLSGFIEADGKFYSNFTVNSKNIVNSVKYYMRISQRKFYHKITEGNNYTSSYLPIMNEIKKFLKVSQLIEINRTHDNHNEKAYEVRTVKKESCTILIVYLSNFPLFSSKYLDFLDWFENYKIHKDKKYKTIEYSNLLFSFKHKNEIIKNWI
uniref:LAGLIDADG homing endonuclease n=1 Tax=Fomitiporia mediterranea TaxID=208960 RepID=A0A5B9RB51_9AGAM|nr:LAGLIDADG homing endonuclease [Fomitiporia mediterranea]QEG57054.1 LAGLIDADG homing endonuclease [Fomitiporia mediterranea]